MVRTRRRDRAGRRRRRPHVPRVAPRGHHPRTSPVEVGEASGSRGGTAAAGHKMPARHFALPPEDRAPRSRLREAYWALRPRRRRSRPHHWDGGYVAVPPTPSTGERTSSWAIARTPRPARRSFTCRRQPATAKRKGGSPDTKRKAGQRPHHQMDQALANSPSSTATKSDCPGCWLTPDLSDFAVAGRMTFMPKAFPRSSAMRWRRSPVSAGAARSDREGLRCLGVLFVPLAPGG